jgi:hypothetical protein
MIKVSAVSYLNTIPFICGLKNSPIFDQIELTLDFPALCADKLLNNQVDIGLIPVTTIPKIKNAQIIENDFYETKYIDDAYFILGMSGFYQNKIFGKILSNEVSQKNKNYRYPIPFSCFYDLDQFRYQINKIIPLKKSSQFRMLEKL